MDVIRAWRHVQIEMKKMNKMLGLMLAAAISISVSPAAGSGADPTSDPGAVLKEFLRAMYSHDTEVAYARLSVADRAVKSISEYAAENGRFEGRALRLARTLADAIHFGDLKTVIEEDVARVTFDASLPDANSNAIAEIVLGFDRLRLAALSAAEAAARLASLRQQAVSGKLPMIHATGETWKLVRENGHWRVHVNWADAVEVRFEAVVHDGLGWEFKPTRGRVMARPGETITVSYRAKNLGAVASTGKARHVVAPDKTAEFLEIVACFCFLDQTLAAGEEVELPLSFRVGFEAPDTVKEFQVRYEFYPTHSFAALANEEKRVER